MAKRINLREFIAAGFDNGQIGFRDSNGFMAGINGSVANGAVVAMHDWVGVKTANVQIPEDVVVPITGDDGILGTFTFPSNAARSFELTVGQLDLRIPNQALGTNIYTIGSYYDTLLNDVVDRDYNDAVLWLSTQAQVKDSGKEGTGFYHVIIPNATLSYLGSQLTEQGEVTHNFRATINPFTVTPFGHILGTGTYTKEKAHLLIWASERRMTMNTYRHDGSSSSFLLSRIPYTDSDGIIRLFAHRSNPNGASGVEVTTAISVVAATRTVTISGVSPFAAGHYLTVGFEY